MTRSIRSVVTALLLCTVAFVSGSAVDPPVANASVTTVTAGADGYTKADVPTQVNATTTPLRVDGSPTWNAYVQFDIPSGTVTSAVLRLTAASTSSSATTVAATGSSWTEADLSYATAPAPGATLGSIAATTSGTTYDVDVTSAVSGGAKVSFALTTASSTARSFNSREATTGKPQLVITLADNSVDTVHTISQMHEDAVTGAFSTKARFEGHHSGTADDPYMFDLTVRQVSGGTTGMNLVFREQDDINFDQLDIEAGAVLLRQKIAGNMITHATGCTGYGALGNSYRVKLLLKGNLWEAYQGNETTPCATWTDTANTFPSGHNASYYCMPGNYCVWEKIEARPLSVSAAPLAWNFTGQSPGYLSSQTINPSGQSILESRPVYTVQNYRFGSAYQGGTSSILDHMEHAADGNVEYHLDEWSDFGTKIVYRATVGQYGYHVDFNNGSTTLRRKNADGTYTTLATANVPLNRHVKVVVTGTRHQLIDEVGCTPPNCPVYWDVTDSTYLKGNKTYWGNVSVSGATLRGSFRALP